MIAALVLAAQVAPVTVTLEQLVAAPDKYAGAQVKLAGQVDACWGMMCAVCPTEATPATVKRDQCLAIGFARDQPSLDRPIRYSGIIFTASFDPTCLREACLDNGAVLRGAVIETVMRRRPSAQGLLWNHEPLYPASPLIAEAVHAQLRADLPADRRSQAVQAFVTADKTYFVCASKPGVWPTSWSAVTIAESDVDPWRCRRVTWLGGRWLLD